MEKKDAQTQTDLSLKNMKVKEDLTTKGKKVFRVENNPFQKLQYHQGKVFLHFD